jgi:hypothetical protein
MRGGYVLAQPVSEFPARPAGWDAELLFDPDGVTAEYQLHAGRRVPARRRELGRS